MLKSQAFLLDYGTCL